MFQYFPRVLGEWCRYTRPCFCLMFSGILPTHLVSSFYDLNQIIISFSNNKQKVNLKQKKNI